jgi:5-formyltetrahydrofolate cyclo-ligase
MRDHCTSDLLQCKQRVRAEALAVRENLDSRLRAEKSTLIAQRCMSLELFRKAQCVFVYISVRSEVQTYAILKAALEQKKTVCVPLIDSGKQEMLACVIRDPSRDLHPGIMGIPEPDRLTCPTVPACDIDCALVPGLAFTEQGHRIGYGGGFYDHFLSGWPGSSCALAFEEQIVANLPFDPDYDVAFGHIITEQRDINCLL